MQEKRSNAIALLIIGIVVGAALSSIIYLNISIYTARPNSTNTEQMQAIINQLQQENQQLRNELYSSSQLNYSLYGLNPVQIYKQANRSVVTIQGLQVSPAGVAVVLGSGFVISYNSKFYIVTNYHVVQGLVNGSVTFWNGNSYPLRIVGTDAYSDLAIVNVSAPLQEFYPLNVASSSAVKVGEPVVAIGNPFGLSGSITFGIISQVGRTISESLAGNFPIADVIQFSAPVNPGNSGGPLLDANGNVIGITTAVFGGSQGVGFAIPSDTLLRELPYLVSTGSYNLHPYLGIQGTDMDLALAQAMHVNVTYGILVEYVVSGGPAQKAGIRAGSVNAVVEGSQYVLGGDIIVSANGTRLINTDSLSTYLEENTLPGQTVVFGVIRNGQLIYVNVTLGTRPPP